MISNQREKMKGGEQDKMPFEIAQVKRCICFRCGNKWIPRNQEETPIRCPSCGSPYWNKPKKPVDEQ